MSRRRSFPVMIMAMVISILTGALTPNQVSALSANDGFNPGANGEVKTIALQSTGKILVGGSFTQLAGDTRNRIGRVNPDGSSDTGFNPNANGAVNVILVQPDDRILVGGSFTSIAGATRHNLARLNADGTIHSTFSHRTDAQVHAIALQADGKILVGGEFTQVLVGTSSIYDRLRLMRLNADGTMDNSFEPDFNGKVYAIAVQTDGRILVGGEFTTVNGQTREKIVRLNKDGSIDPTFSASTDWSVRAVAVQKDGKILLGGTFTTVNGTSRPGFARLYSHGAMDFTVNMDLGGTFKYVFSLAVQADGKVLLGGMFMTLKTEARTKIGRMNTDGTLDTDFNLSLGLSDSRVNTIAVQPDGKILLGGTFTQSEGFVYNSIIRCYPDSSRDQALNVTLDYKINAVAIQPAGQILVGGDFTSLGGIDHFGIGRILPGGAVDHTFETSIVDPGYVYAIVVQPDGKTLVGGDFSNINTTTRHNLGRLNAGGTLDYHFSIDVNGPVYAIALDPNGKIIIGGDFTQVGGTATENLARLNADGTVDTTFATFDFSGEGDGVVYTVAYQNGKILVGGNFSQINGNWRNCLARVDSSGNVEAYDPYPDDIVRTILPLSDGAHLIGGDFTKLGEFGVDQVIKSRIAKIDAKGDLVTSFEGYANNNVYTMVEQDDGKIVVGGAFTSLSTPENGFTRNYIGRFNADGTIDEGFNPGANATVLGLAIQPDGKLIAVGEFTILAGSSRSYIGRLSIDQATSQSLTVDTNGTMVTWLRSGPGPEFQRVTFEYSTDGINYGYPNGGYRVEGGWRSDDLGLPFDQNIYYRVRGYTTGGLGNGSGWYVETMWNLYLGRTKTYLPMILR